MASQISQGTIKINMDSKPFTREQVKELITQVNEALSDGVEIKPQKNDKIKELYETIDLDLLKTREPKYADLKYGGINDK